MCVIDLNKLSSPNDVMCDDMSVWNREEAKKIWVSVNDDGDVPFLKESNLPGSDASLCMEAILLPLIQS